MNALTLIRARLLSVALSMLSASALAHHGFYGRYALDEPFDFTGTVVDVEWVNPHAFVLVRTGNEGAATTFRIELQGLRQLTDKGWNGTELKAGDTVRVVNAAREIGESSTLVCCARVYDSTGREIYTDPRRPGPERF